MIAGAILVGGAIAIGVILSGQGRRPEPRPVRVRADKRRR